MILERNPNPVTPAQGTLVQSNLTVDSQELLYTGMKVDGLNVTVNNTDTANGYNAELYMAIRDKNGTLQVEDTATATFTAGEVKTVQFTFVAQDVQEVSKIEVMVKETSTA